MALNWTDGEQSSGVLRYDRMQGERGPLRRLRGKGTAAKPEDLSFIRRIHVLEGEDQLQDGVF